MRFNDDALTTRQRLHLLTTAILAGFTLVSLALIFWSVVRANAILARDDNPRLVETELRIQRGSIWDRNGRLLAQTSTRDNQLQRVYPFTTIGPAVGYYSFRHGTAGIEESYNAVLRGDTTSSLERWWQQTLHRPAVGQDIRLTLDATLQQQADTLMHDQPGALILLQVTDAGAAEVLAMVSHPGYNPNLLDEQFDDLVNDDTAPLLNRVTQSQYQPGLTVQPFLLAMALEQGVIRLNDPVTNPNRPVPVNSIVTRCTHRPADPATWADVLQNQCPGPMLELADQLGMSGLDQTFAAFGLTQVPDIPLAVAEVTATPIADLQLASIGQENLTVTPLQLSLALAALAKNGRLPTPQLVIEIQNSDEVWQPVVVSNTHSVSISSQTAFAIRTALPQMKNVYEFAVPVLSGPEESTNAWYLGIYPASSPRYVLVLVLENDANLSGVIEIGRSLFVSIDQ